MSVRLWDNVQYARAAEAAQSSINAASSISHSIHRPNMIHLDSRKSVDKPGTSRSPHKYGYTRTPHQTGTGGLVDGRGMRYDVGRTEPHKLNFELEVDIDERLAGSSHLFGTWMEKLVVDILMSPMAKAQAPLHEMGNSGLSKSSLSQQRIRLIISMKFIEIFISPS